VLVQTDPVRLALEARDGWQAEPAGFEQLVMAYLQRSSGAAAAGNPVTSQAVTR
jgi:hypothetical protein